MIRKTINWGIGTLNKYVLLRYVVSGGTAGLTLLLALYIFNSLLKVHYLISSVFAFVVAFVVSFVLQKFWTFKDHSTDGIHKQTVIYLVTSLFGLGLNTLLMYLFVDYVHMGVIQSQILTGGLVACCTFFISRDFVFKYKEEEHVL